LHVIPIKIISYRDPKFTSNILEGLFEWLGSKLNIIIVYHPQTNVKNERNNQILEDMIHMYVMKK
jgi:hypothetical protein